MKYATIPVRPGNQITSIGRHRLYRWQIPFCIPSLLCASIAVANNPYPFDSFFTDTGLGFFSGALHGESETVGTVDLLMCNPYPGGEELLHNQGPPVVVHACTYSVSTEVRAELRVTFFNPQETLCDESDNHSFTAHASCEEEPNQQGWWDADGEHKVYGESTAYWCWIQSWPMIDPEYCWGEINYPDPVEWNEGQPVELEPTDDTALVASVVSAK